MKYKVIHMAGRIASEHPEYARAAKSLGATIRKEFDESVTMLVVPDQHDGLEQTVAEARSRRCRVETSSEFERTLLVSKLSDEGFRFNMDERTRLEILAPFIFNRRMKSNGDVEVSREPVYYGGSFTLVGLSARDMRVLIALDFMDPDEAHNRAPYIWQLVDFGEKYPFVRFGGYAVSPDRKDYRISIENIDFHVYKGELEKYPDFTRDFTRIAKGSDESFIDSSGPESDARFYAWFD